MALIDMDFALGGGSTNHYQVMGYNGDLNYVLIKDGNIESFSYYSSPATYIDDNIKVIFGDTVSYTFYKACDVYEYRGTSSPSSSTHYSANSTASKSCKVCMDIQF